MGSSNERRYYKVTQSLIGWEYTQNDPWSGVKIKIQQHLKLETGTECRTQNDL